MLGVEAEGLETLQKVVFGVEMQIVVDKGSIVLGLVEEPLRFGAALRRGVWVPFDDAAQLSFSGVGGGKEGKVEKCCGPSDDRARQHHGYCQTVQT